jgi:preprotein translocase subunit SecE
MNRLARYFRDTMAEMKHVKWPTQNQAMIYTALVIGISAVVTVFVSLADFVFTSGIDSIVNTF